MSRKEKAKLEMKTGRPMRLGELQPSEAIARAVPSVESPKQERHVKRRDWLEPRSPTRTTSLMILAGWLGLDDPRAVRAAADAGEIRLREEGSRR